MKARRGEIQLIFICMSCILFGCHTSNTNQIELKTKLADLDQIGDKAIVVEKVKSPIIPFEKQNKVPEFDKSKGPWDLRNMDLRDVDLSNNPNLNLS